MGALPGARVRSTLDGQLGYIVEQEGRLWVRLDRRGENRLLPYHEQQWTADKEPPLTAIQIARIAHDGDRAWRLVHGEYGLKEWMSLREEERHAWLKGPPEGADPRRLRLYAAVKGALLQ